MEKAADQLSTADGSSRFLPVKAVYCDGGFYSEAYMCHNMLKDDTSCYCSFKRSGINVVCALPELEPLTVSSIEVIAPSTGYTCPIRQGVVFSCWNWPSLSSLARYGQAHSLQEVRQVYEKSKRRQEESRRGSRQKEGQGGAPAADAMQQRDQELEELLEPILFFDMDTSYHCSFALNVPRSGRFLVVKLLSSRNRGLNIDVQFVGFRGWTGPTSFAHGEFI